MDQAQFRKGKMPTIKTSSAVDVTYDLDDLKGLIQTDLAGKGVNVPLSAIEPIVEGGYLKPDESDKWGGPVLSRPSAEERLVKPVFKGFRVHHRTVA